MDWLMNVHEIWHWVESHPYITAGIVFGAGTVIVIGYEALGAGSSGPPLSVNDQIRLTRAQAAAQRSLITAQNAPALAQVRGQTAQTRIGATANTAQTRIGAATSNLANRLGLQATTAGYANTIGLANIGAKTQLAGYANNLALTQAQDAADAKSQQLSALLAAILASISSSTSEYQSYLPAIQQEGQFAGFANAQDFPSPAPAMPTASILQLLH